MRLERRLELSGCLERELDPDVGRGQSRVDVPPGLLVRLRREPLLVERDARVDDMRERLDLGRERRQPSRRRVERVGGDESDRLARVLWLGSQERRRRSQSELGVGAEHGADTRDGARRPEVERADVAVRDR